MNRKVFISMAAILFLSTLTLATLISCKEEKIKNVPNFASAPVALSADSLRYVGREECKDCHQTEYSLWQNSHHDLAMRVANANTVLGDFSNSSVTIFGVTSKFYKKGEIFYVETEGQDGDLHEYEIAYTFGVSPLQQYLVNFPSGRVQVLPLCWDTRPREKGGQRWFHIYADEQIKPNDILFWTRINQNWNYMCAECHSTNLRKSYDYKTEQYNTTFFEINVSCEACHGPGSEHVAWAKVYEKEKRITVEGDKGLKIRLKDLNKGIWVFNDMQKGTAERTVPLSSTIQIEMCGRCHARRSALTDDYIYGQPLLETHRVPPLEESLYYDDGQIREEVYVYGSFLQSKMYHQGVICSDCHEPHSTKVYMDDNSLCYRCHLQQKYDTKTHHFHKPEDRGGSCRDCHMAETTYMVVDPRRDHSIRLPRPDLSLKLGSLNACNQCHQDKSIQWSINYMTEWYGRDYSQKPHYGNAIHAARLGVPQAEKDLINLIRDEVQPNIVKSTALSLLNQYPGENTLEVIRSSLYDKDPMIRLSAISALEPVEVNTRFALVKPLLEDPVKSVRLRAVDILGDVPQNAMTSFDRSVYETALSEYIETQLFNADHPSAQMNLGIVYLRKGQRKLAEQAYKKTIVLEPGFVYSYINLSDLYRQEGRDSDGEIVLNEAISYNPQSADLYYARGLLYTRQKKRDAATTEFAKAANLAPDNAHLQYYYALSVMQTGQIDKCLSILENGHKINPYNVDILYALTTINRDNNNRSKALMYVQKLIELFPKNQMYNQLLNQIRGMNNSQE